MIKLDLARVALSGPDPFGLGVGELRAEYAGPPRVATEPQASRQLLR